MYLFQVVALIKHNIYNIYFVIYYIYENINNFIYFKFYLKIINNNILLNSILLDNNKLYKNNRRKMSTSKIYWVGEMSIYPVEYLYL